MRYYSCKDFSSFEEIAGWFNKVENLGKAIVSVVSIGLRYKVLFYENISESEAYYRIHNKKGGE